MLSLSALGSSGHCQCFLLLFTVVEGQVELFIRGRISCSNWSEGEVDLLDGIGMAGKEIVLPVDLKVDTSLQWHCIQSAIGQVDDRGGGSPEDYDELVALVDEVGRHHHITNADIVCYLISDHVEDPDGVVGISLDQHQG